MCFSIGTIWNDMIVIGKYVFETAVSTNNSSVVRVNHFRYRLFPFEIDNQMNVLFPCIFDGFNSIDLIRKFFDTVFILFVFFLHWKKGHIILSADFEMENPFFTLRDGWLIVVDFVLSQPQIQIKKSFFSFFFFHIVVIKSGGRNEGKKSAMKIWIHFKWYIYLCHISHLWFIDVTD